jgi:hypothetical protein
MNDMFLSHDEISSMTSRVQRAAQLRALRGMGIEHRVRPDGTLAVMRAHVEKVFGAAAAGSRKAPPKEPNWGALDATRS